jgi:uncharacterized repeat protein (TIGR01451 family)
MMMTRATGIRSIRPRAVVALSAVALATNLVVAMPAVSAEKGVNAFCAVGPKAGPFSPTNPVTLVQGQDLVFRIATQNDSPSAPALFDAHFTATLDRNFFFGEARVIYTQTRAGGDGWSFGGVDEATLSTAGRPPGTDRMVVTIVSDVTGDTVLATCDFQLTLLGTSATADTDRDGLLDSWETGGFDADGDGTVDVDLPGFGANAAHKDLFLEIDWLPGEAPRRANVQALKQAFKQAPVNAGGTANPDGNGGINLWVDTGGLMEGGMRVGDNLGGGNEIPEMVIPNLNNGSAFYEAKRSNFAGARSAIFRYAIEGHAGDADPPSGGWGEWGGNDFIDYNHDAATLMHEFGHNLGLGHGGNEGHNCKPNYLSVMNYDHATGVRQRSGSPLLDYSPPLVAGSRGAAPLPPLVENHLNETAVLDPTDGGSQIVFVNGNGQKVRAGVSGTVDWNGDSDRLDSDVTVNVDTWPGDPDSECFNETDSSTLRGYDDWANISLPFRQFGNSNDGPINLAHPDHHDPTLADSEALDDALNATDLAVTIADAPDPVVEGGQLVYTIVVSNKGPNPADGTKVVQSLPAQASYVGNDAGCAANATTVTCVLGTVDAGGIRTVHVTVGVPAGLVRQTGGYTALTTTAIASYGGGSDIDSTNNSATAVTQVVYAFGGLLAPLDNPGRIDGVRHVVRAGAGVPVRFSLGGNQGLAIFDPGSPYSRPISCESGAPSDPVEETVSASASGLTYDATTDVYTYIWKTDKRWAGTCRTLNLRLNDGSDHLIAFEFT